MRTFSASWRWPQWTLLAVALALLASDLHLLSWAPAKLAVDRLASQPAVRGAFGDSASSRQEALFIVFAFLLLAPVNCLAAWLIGGFVGLVVSSALESLGRRPGIPELAAVAWSPSASWLPPLLWPPAMLGWMGLPSSTLQRSTKRWPARSRPATTC